MYTMTPFDQLTWGDTMLAQLGGSDAQAYATDPAGHALQTMTTGLEQAPASLSEYVSGANQSAQQAATSPAPAPPWWQSQPVKADGSPCEWWNVFCTFENVGGRSSGGVLNGAIQATQDNGKTIGAIIGTNTNGKPGFNLQQTGVFVVVGLLAVGLILLGAKSIMEV